MRNRTYPPRYEPQTNWINIVLVAVFVVLGLAILAAVAPAIVRNWSQGTTPQPTAFVQMQPTNRPVVDPGGGAAPLPTAAPVAGSPPDVIPTPAPLEVAPVGASGLTESMERKFEEAANPGLADQILNVVESWGEATPIPGGKPPVDKGGKKELGRPMDGGTSGDKHWEPKP